MNEIKIGFGPFSKPRINREAFDAVLKSEVVGENTATYEFETPVTAIGAHAFFDTNKGIEEDLFLHYIELPDSVETIHPETFDGICKLKSKLLVDNMLIIDNVLIKHFDSYNSGEERLPEGMTAIAPGALSGFWAKKIILPSTLKEIGKEAFRGCTHLTSVKLPKGLEKIGDYAFSNTALGTATIPDSVTSIGVEAFSDCSKLKKIKIGKSVERIGERVVSRCHLLATIDGRGASADKRMLIFDGTLLAYTAASKESHLEIPEGVKRIGSDALFDAKNLTSVTLPSSLESIGTGAFQRSSITEIEVPESVTTIEYGAFSTTIIEKFSGKFATADGSALVEGNTLLAGAGNRSFTLNIPENVTEIAPMACYLGEISGVTFPDCVTVIGSKAFAYCSNMCLPVDALPKNLEIIGEMAFEQSVMRSDMFRDGVIIPANVKEIGYHAFFSTAAYSASANTYWFEPVTPPKIDTTGMRINAIYVPEEALEAYRNAYPEFSDKIHVWER